MIEMAAGTLSSCKLQGVYLSWTFVPNSNRVVMVTLALLRVSGGPAHMKYLVPDTPSHVGWLS